MAATLRTFSIRLEYADDTFEIIDVAAYSIDSALLVVADHPYAVRSFCIGSVDRAPQTALAFG